MMVRNWVPVYLVGLCLILLSYTSAGHKTFINRAMKHASRDSLDNLMKKIDTRINEGKKSKTRKNSILKNKVKESPKTKNNIKNASESIEASSNRKIIVDKNVKKPKKEKEGKKKIMGRKISAMKDKTYRQNIDISSGSACDQTLTLATFYTYNIYTNYELNDKGKKTCSVTFKGMQETDKFFFICREFSLQENCKKESLQIKDLTSGAEGKYCGSSLKSDQSSDSLLKSDGSSISITYARKKVPKKKCPSAGFFCQISSIPEEFANTKKVVRGVNTELGNINSWIGLGAKTDVCGGETTLDYGNTAMVYSSYDSRGKTKCMHTVKGPDDVNLNVKCSVFNMANPCKKENLQVLDKMSSGKAKKYCKDNELSEYATSGSMLEFKLNIKKLKKKQCQGSFICQVSVPNVLCTDQWPNPQFDGLPYCEAVNGISACSCAEFQLAGGCDDDIPQPDIDYCKRTCQICEDFGTVDESNKPGECPNVGDFIGTCDITALSCTLDEECPSISKCCPFGCGKQCLVPVPSVCEAGTDWIQGCEQCSCLENGATGCLQLANCNYCPPSNPTHPNCNIVKPTEKPIVKPTVKPTEKPNPSTGTRPYCDNCGTSSISIARGVDGNRIVGGQQATKGEYPWQVYLGLIFGSSDSRCGGSIIKKRWILSAAHCFTREIVGALSKLEIHVGAHDLQDLSDPNYQIIVINKEDIEARVTDHPNYDEITFENDIALIELKQDLVFTSRIAPVCLADVSDFAAGKQGVATGWGIESYGASTATDILLEVGLDTIDLATCQDLYQKPPYNYAITDTMICTLTTGKDACSGDSGGPLVVQLDNGKWVQIGLTSFGFQCAYPNAPGVWTNVAKYKTWIDQTTGSNQC